MGVPGGIPTRPTIYKNIVTDLGADPTGVVDCTAIVQSALQSCPAGEVVYAPAGTFRLNGRVYTGWSVNNVTLRGAGPGITIFKGYGNQSAAFLFGSSAWPPPVPTVPITAGATRGSNTITVANASSFTVGMPISIAASPMPIWSHNLGGSPDSVLNLRITFKIVSKTATTITLDSPCPFDFTGLNPLATVFPGSPNVFVQGIGIENLTIDLSFSQIAWAIEFDTAYGCWVNNVEITGAYSRQMLFYQFVRGEVRHCYTHATQGSGPNHEGIDFDRDCCWNLVEDNIANQGGDSPFQFGDADGGNSCNVVAYNYALNTDPGFWDISFNHGPHDMLNLAEGNVIDNFKDDGYFGSSSHNTLFRNRIRYNLELKHFSNYYNIVGNVLGTTGFSDAYETEQVNYSNNPVYALGFPNIGNHSYSGTFGPTTPPNYSGLPDTLDGCQQLDLNVEATILRHGNFDYFNNATVWDPTIPDHVIPDSLYLAARPVWWTSNIPWPPIGPDLTPMVSQIPAEYRFLNGTPTPTPTSTPTSTPMPSATATSTSRPTATPTATATGTPRATPTPSTSPTPTATTTPTPSPTLTPSATPPPTPPAGLVAAYNFNEGNGTTVNDASGNGNNGAINGATWTTYGKYGNALSFNGSNSRVTVPDSASLHLTTGMTLEAWVYPTTVSSAWRDVIEKGNDNYYLTATALFGAGVPATCGTWAKPPVYGISILLVNVWSHLASTYDGATLRLYVNGAQVASKPVTGSIGITTDALTFGSDPFYGQYLSGRIDDIRIYNRALSQAEIQADMNTPVGSPSPTPTATPTPTPHHHHPTPTPTPSATPTPR